MFTGLIEETGSVKKCDRSGSGYLLTVSCDAVLDNIKIGDSIAIDGVCQTVTEFDRDSFSVFVSKVTAELTTLAAFKKGQIVNLERAMQAGARFGGHIVQGHVDGKASVSAIETDESGTRYTLELLDGIERYLVKKGSVTVNGISLTVVDVVGAKFSLYIIPETIQRTNLKLLEIGDVVNIETDILAKYVERMLSAGRSDDSAEKDEALKKKLMEEGFI